MEIITNKLMKGDRFAEKVTEFANWCEKAFIVSAFFTDDSLIKILNNQGKKVCLIVSLRPPTSYDSLLRISALTNVEVRFLGHELHSKIYCFKNGDIIKSAIGSSNLTGKGFYDNIETNVILSEPDASLCYENWLLIKNKSHPLTSQVLEEYKAVFQSYKTPVIKEILPIQTSSDTEYNKLWSAVDFIANLVSTELDLYFKEIPKYLVIDHFWHFIVSIRKDNHEEISKRMKLISSDEYLISLFKSFIEWDSENEFNTKSIYQRSLRLNELLNSKKSLNKKELLEVFKTLHSTYSRTQRFLHDEHFINENNIQRVNVSIKHLINEDIPLDERIEDLSKPDYELKYFGSSAIREFNGWCYPNKYPIRNEKADEALSILSFG
ncbi:phospholipase D family protein [Vibrio splendidus]|uniref:phospholipase D family protein n=1 Tax=Vibrio splendidus TaxID=29497 RepID=UPI001E59FB1C|nr:phospholipase D family protein [Vibrio splendidus]MCC4860686.1 phospholipase D family protein [Vibrio splendidus]